MTLLIISPDYASHLLPLATLGTAWRDAGRRVVVATGPATAGIVAEFGFEHVTLQLGRGSNPGVIRAEEQAEAEEADSLRGFFDATRVGMVETLRYQAEERLTDLMWQPVEKARATLAVVEEVRPDAILVDHLAFSARLGLSVAGVPFGDVVLGHPSALPVGDEPYGFPPAWPRAFAPDAAELAELRALCDRVEARFTAEWNRAAAELDPTAAAPAASDAFAGHGPVVLYNYPEQLVDAETAERMPPRVFLGSAVRTEAVDPEVEAWIAGLGGAPYVYVSFGSFLSVRGDVLRRVVSALADAGVAAAVASGSTPVADLGPVPEVWLVREFLPQVRLLDEAAAAVTHGGNNSVTEALAAGVPLLVMPFSTDQFAGAAALESAELGIALDPNTADVASIRSALEELLALDAGQRAAWAELSDDLRGEPGPQRAFAALTSSAIASGSDAAER